MSAELKDALPAIAIIGMAGRFPGARNVEEFWQNLCSGTESISFFTEQELRQAGVDERTLSDARYVRANGVLADIDLFDADFFGFTPREAAVTDPQHRIFLECAWEALENAGYDSERFNGRIGMYAGAGISTYLLRNLISPEGLPAGVSEFQILMGNNKDYVPTRASYKLNLKGPSINVNTACSSSLVAVHLACQSLLDYGCDMALAGGVAIQVPQIQGYLYEDGGIGSPDGHCRAFDSKAEGAVGGNGVGLVVLRRLTDATEHGDCIHAIIRSSAVNNDGHAKAGYTAPGVDGQAEVIEEALALAGVESDSISYVETHGTGTALGDPVEIAALTQAFRPGTSRTAFCAIGSLKTNIGHLDEAAGVAGLIKAALALENKQIPASLHFNEPNPKIDFASTPFFVNTGLMDWSAKTPRRAGVSSFGIGGTNAHAVLEEPPPRPPSSASRKWSIVPLSARSEGALEEATSNLSSHFRKQPCNLADAAYMLSVGRRAFRYRRALVVDGLENAIATLDSNDAKHVFSGIAGDVPAPVIFMFPGQGTQHVNMGIELHRNERLFRYYVNECAEILRGPLGYDFRQVLYPTKSESDAAARRLNRTALAQPILFAIEYALARLWMSWGVQPQAMIGHSLGEYVAACLAGVFSLEDGLLLVAARGALMEQLTGGGMLAVPLPDAEVRSVLPRDLYVAARNGPSLTVVSGAATAVQAFRGQLAERGVEGHQLATSHAFHSPAMDPVLQPLLERIRKIHLRSPELPYMSNLTGDWITAAQATDPMYWVKHSRETVRFGEGLEKCFTESGPVLLEVGPGRNLASAALRHPRMPPEQLVCTSMPHPQDHQPDDRFLLSTVAKLWTAGVPIDWAEFYVDERRHRIPLPTYPFERQSYWIERPKNEGAAPDKNADMARWFYAPSWKRSVLPDGGQRTHDGERWLLFVDERGLGSQLAERLRNSGKDVSTVSIGRRFERVSPRTFILDPARREHYLSLISELSSPNRIVHLWSIDPDSSPDILDRGLYSLIYLMQAIRTLGLNGDIQITAVSCEIHEVIGDELIRPAASTLLGPLKVLPQECPGLTCRSIDIRARDEQLIHNLEAQLTGSARDPVVAWRGPHRWLQTYEPVHIGQIDANTSRLRHGGVYLITGGLGGIGMIVADYLARTYRAKLVLTGRTGLPPRTEARHTFALADQADRISTTDDLTNDYSEFSRAANQLCSSYIYDYFSQLGLQKGQTYSEAELQRRLRILPKFAKFFNFFVRVLSADSIIRRSDDGTVEFLKNPDEMRSPNDARIALERDYPEFAGVIGLLDHCVRHYPAALSGDIEAIGVLYPDGSSALLEKAGRNTTARSQRDVFIVRLKELIGDLVRNSAGRTVRILEAGIGDRILTSVIAPSLVSASVEYWATDIGRSFVLKAEQEAARAGLGFMKFGTLDIARDPAPQGFEPSSFDLVLALDVVHATPNISETVKNLSSLLAPGGVLALIETAGSQRWVDMIWGLADGWWSFEDREIREHSPLLDLGQWEALLSKSGFETAQVHPLDQRSREKADYGLLLAQRARADVPQHISSIHRLEQLGAEVLVLAADVADEDQMQRVIATTCERFGPLNGVVHAAGVTSGDVVFNLVDETTRAGAEALFRPKVEGTVVLEKVLRGQTLDFCLLISSNAAILGGLGFSAYAAANLFMDAFASEQRRTTGQPWISANWDGWPTEESSGSTVRFQTSIDRFAMTRAECEQAFERVLSQNSPHIVVSAGDLNARLQHWGVKRDDVARGDEPRPNRNNGTAAFHTRPGLPNPYAPPETGTEKRLCAIWQELFGINKIGVHDNFFELRGDSLLGAQLVATASKAFAFQVPIRSIFEHSTIASLAQRIDDLQSTAQALQAVPARPLSVDEEEGSI